MRADPLPADRPSGRGLVAVGDSVTRGRGGSPLLRVHPQSWALWVAEALELPYTNVAVDGARAADLARDQLPRLGDGYDLACLYIGVNDARSTDFDPVSFDRDVGVAMRALRERADRLLVLTIPLDLGRPRAGRDVVTANAILRRLAGQTGAAVCELADFRGRTLVLPDAVHPTAPGQVAIAERALDALAATGLRARRRPAELAEQQTSPAAFARYAAWYARQVVRENRRRLRERMHARMRSRCGRS